MDKTSVILIVDDNPTNLNVLFERLEESGFEVSVAQSGETALEQLEHVNPDLILLDVMMPGMNGFETCQQLKKDAATRDIPVIFMTALTDTVDKIKGFLAGGADYITKPLQHEEVLVRINAHLKIRKLEKQLETQQQLLQEKDTLLAQKDRRLSEFETYKQTFFSYISSELQTPLNTLLGFTRVIIENIDRSNNEQIKSDVMRLQSSAEKLQAQYGNLLLWAKLQRGIIECTPGPFNIAEIVVYNTVLFTPAAKQKQIALNSDIQEQILAFADYNMVNAILHNLINNALQFTDTGGKINISAVEREKEVQIFIADTGVGIEQEYLRRLFQPTLPETEDAQEKIGLGLLLCKELVERNGGRIWAESKPGEGTTFIFTLPKLTMEEKGSFSPA